MEGYRTLCRDYHVVMRAGNVVAAAMAKSLDERFARAGGSFLEKLSPTWNFGR